MFNKYIAVKMEQLKSKIRSGPFLRKKLSINEKG